MDPEEIEIILVEDNPDDAYFTKRAFTEANVNNHIIVISDGGDAIDFFFNNKILEKEGFEGKSKLILLDIHLPKVDGLEILSRLKKDNFTKKIPVVVLTSDTNDPMMKKALELGAENYIIKPVTYEGFIEVVHKLNDRWC